MAIIKKMSLDRFQLIHFDLEHIVSLCSHEKSLDPAKHTKKRKVSARTDLNIDNLIFRDVYRNEEDNDISQAETVDLVETNIKFCAESPVYIGNTELLNNIFVSDDIKLEITEGLLVAKSKKVRGLDAKVLLSFGLHHLSKPSLASELSILNMANLKLRRNGLSIAAPHLKVEVLTESNTVNVSISYKILSHCDIHRVVSGDLMTKLNSIIQPQIDQPPKESEHVTAALYYTCISDHTARMSSVTQNYDIPELEATLLGFQKKTVNWLLSKENVQYDPNGCTRVPLITSHDYNMFKRYLEENIVNSTLDNQISQVLDKLYFGWKVVKIGSKEFYYNRYTANLISRNEVCRYLVDYYERNNEEYPQYLPAQGLLAEEMGLGKTVEMTALILMNQRPIEEINGPIKIQLQSYGDFKIIVKSKTTLVIAPDSILKQWIEEIVHLVPSLAVTIYHGVGKYPKLDNNPILIAEYLRKFDVVFTTYSIISKELDYALYSSRNKSTRTRRTKTEDESEGSTEPPGEFETPEDALLNDYQSLFQIAMKSTKPRVANAKSSESQHETDYERALQDEISLAIRHNKVPSIYKSFNYESPLMLSQFWRVILDEVQMASSKLSRAFQSSSLIPRFHSWGVSGTPIKKNLDDLHSVLKFLRVYPFCNEMGKNSWDLLLKHSADFAELWQKTAIRHTKAMTHDEIKLPPQNRILLSIPFTPVEQDLYNQLLEECLATICLDVNGNPISNDWEPSSTIMMYMRTWLSRLRQVCCNPQIGKLNVSHKKYRKSYNYSNRTLGMIQKLKTLENLLDDMLTKAYNEVLDVEKQLYQLFLDLGEFNEFIYQPQTSLVVLTAGSKKTERILYRTKLILNKLIDDYKAHRAQLMDGQMPKVENDNEIGNIETSSISVSKDSTLDKLEDKIRSLRIRIRSLNVSLHRFYFLIASAYFQQYDQEYGEIIKEFEPKGVTFPPELQKLEQFDDDELKDELASLVSNVELIKFQFEEVDHTKHIKLEEYDIEAATEEEGRYKYLERKYYGLAEQTRSEILQHSIENVNKTVSARISSRNVYHSGEFKDNGELHVPKNTKSFFMKLPIMTIEHIENYAVSMSIKVYVDSLVKIISQLNGQAEVINEWMEDMIGILRKPLLSNDKTPDGEEYEESIRDQDRASSYLFVLGQVLSDRFEVLNGSESSIKIVSIKKAQEQRDAEIELQKVNETDFLNNLQAQRQSIKPTVKKSLQELVLQVKTLESDLKDESKDDESKRTEVQLELLEKLAVKLRVVYDNQKSGLTLLQKELNVNCNAVFNARTDYFKQLQQISDSVKTSNFGMDRKNLNPLQIQQVLNNYEQYSTAIKGKMDKSVAKFRYLRGLVRSNEPSQDFAKYGEDELMCSICRCTITIGSLTQCGHKFCKDCLEQWLRTARNCPMCKSSISMDSVYNFTHHKPDLKATKVEDHMAGGSSVAKNLHSIYKPISEEVIDEIQQIKLHHSYSTKVDLIVKQVLYLRSRDPGVQIVIFSQWQDMLYILGTALKASEVSYLGSEGTFVPDSRGKEPKKLDLVEYFKDPKNEITCFLLNAKAQSSGLTLINSTHIFLCEPLVNTSLELQAISRIHRIGQTKPTTVWMFIIENTVEESVVLTSTNKRLQYLQGDSDVDKATEKNLSKAESIALMNSEGNDSLINKGASRGESVTNSDLWNAFFSARSTNLLTNN